MVIMPLLRSSLISVLSSSFRYASSFSIWRPRRAYLRVRSNWRHQAGGPHDSDTCSTHTTGILHIAESRRRAQSIPSLSLPRFPGTWRIPAICSSAVSLTGVKREITLTATAIYNSSDRLSLGFETANCRQDGYRHCPTMLRGCLLERALPQTEIKNFGRAGWMTSDSWKFLTDQANR